MDQATENLSGIADLDALIADERQAAATAAAAPAGSAAATAAAEDAGDETAGNLAVLAVSAIELAFKRLDSRLAYSDETREEGRGALGPLLARLNLGAGVDRMPYREEIAAGWFLGRLIKSSLLRLRQLWARDAREAKEPKRHGNQPEHVTQEQASAVVRAQRARQIDGDANHQSDSGAWI